ncbi:MAG: flagellar biosynthesis protein FlhF [Spirochaetes bacterium]|nr:MAG: flagellar biosynthesis protein FlhF [Spirochaetota bacterium]
MQYFTIQATSHREALEKMKVQYGDTARILTHRNIRIGGFLGLFSHEGVEITGYLSKEPVRRKTVQLEEAKSRILDNVKKDQTLSKLLEEIQTLRKDMKLQNNTENKHHPSINEIEMLLKSNDFTEDFIKEAVNWLETNFSLEELANRDGLQNAILEWIGNKISIGNPILFNRDGNGKIVTIIGPTGVGKTTTIAKLAAIYGIGNSGIEPKNVRIVTIDYYRIGAEQQIKKYGEIMKIPVSSAETREDLKKILAIYRDTDLILIDTIGKSPKDYEKLGEMKNLLDVCGKQSDTFLALSATTKASDAEDIMRHFEPFNYRSVILTKLDETARIGNIISILSKKRKSVAYISDGQSVPQDFEKASVVRFLMNMDGFRVNRELLEEKFGKREASLKGIWS